MTEAATAFKPHVEAGAPPFASLVPSPARASSLGDALEFKLTSFAAGTGNGAWPKLPRAAIASRLTVLAKDASKVDQAGLNACGPAMAMHLFAKRKPLQFADFAIALYERGKAKFGTLDVSGDGLFGKDPSSMTWDGNKPELLDWMLLSSVLRSEGGLTRFSGEPSDDFSGITFPGELQKWLSSGVGYSSVDDQANVFLDKDLDHLRKLSPAADLDIVVLINVGVIQGTPKKGKAKQKTGISNKVQGMFPNHYFELEKPVVDDGTTITATGWTWGLSGYPFKGDRGDWKDGYYGALLAKV